MPGRRPYRSIPEHPALAPLVLPCVRRPLADDALSTLLREHSSLREEIRDRLKIAFSHVGYAGAIAAFTIPLILKLKVCWGWKVLLGFLALGGFGGLVAVAYLNMRWVQHLGNY